MSLDKKQIIDLMERLDQGQALLFQLSPTFGSHYVHITVNPKHPQKGEKKFVMQWGKSLEAAKTSSPFLTTDKAKKIASWVAERDPSPLA